MKAEWVIACRYAEHQDNGPTIVGAGQGTTLVAETPTRTLLYIVLCLSATWYELQAEDEHELTWAITGPDGNERQPMRSWITPGMPPAWGFPEGSSGRRLEALEMVIHVEEPGLHVVRFSIDGSVALLEHNFVVGSDPQPG